MIAHTWRGRRGAVLLGPTEHRVARYLDDRTRRGRVTIRMADLVAGLGLERSEGYRITRRLRVLGLFGIENDRSGQLGGRRFWRTTTEHDGVDLDRTRHRDAWARIKGWARARSMHARARLHHLRERAGTTLPARRPDPSLAAGPSFRELVGWEPPAEWRRVT